NVADNDCVRSDLGSVADEHGAENLCACADHDVLAERWVAFARVPRRATERDAMIERAIVADFCGLADHHTHSVVDDDTPADYRAGMDFDSSQEASPVSEPAREP